MFPAQLSMRQTAELIFSNTNKSMMNQTGSGFGAGFFYAKMEKADGTEIKVWKKPRFCRKIRACQKLLQNYDFFNIQKRETDLSNGD